MKKASKNNEEIIQLQQIILKLEEEEKQSDK